MIKYICDIKDCGSEAHHPYNTQEWVDQEMFTILIDSFPYFWFRVGIANVTLCEKHRAIAMNKLAEDIKENYPI